MDEQLISGHIKKLRNLSQYKDHTEEQLRKKVIKSLEKKSKENLEVENLFDSREEKKAAKQLAIKYLNSYNPVTVSDKNSLRSLIYLEIIQMRLQTISNNFAKESEGGVNLKMMTAIHNNLDKIAIRELNKREC